MFVLATVVLVILKLLGIIAIPWLFCFIPLLVILAYWLFVGVLWTFITTILLAVVAFFERK